jgi:DNA-directed RNA polymerase specialized sigma24 family protein
MENHPPRHPLAMPIFLPALRLATGITIKPRPATDAPNNMASEPSKSSIFPRTDWAELSEAAEADEARLDRLIRLYWQPLRIFLVATFPGLKHQADTLLQDFAEDKLLKEGWLRKADQNRGRFRDFLKTSLRNFILDHLNQADVKNPPISLEELEQEPPQPDNLAEEFDLAWARTVLAETLRRMEADCKNPSKDQPRRGYIWEMFRIRLLEPVFNDAPQPSYDQLIDHFGLKSPTDASNTLLSAKRIFKAHLIKVIKEYAGQDSATATEIQALEDFLVRLAKRG